MPDESAWADVQSRVRQLQNKKISPQKTGLSRVRLVLRSCQYARTTFGLTLSGNTPFRFHRASLLRRHRKLGLKDSRMIGAAFCGAWMESKSAKNETASPS
ncbi:hypothetical protein EC9_54280 [Rosistilla ulvae]|uniref:Uncharacterized protein n=1 Tax=Rosistilla ulvae TaxID=1930277 RepID=A0A517M8J3_9BACT|nr:hypothetical protein EC9_54280 [Rosistilla ulvae]